MKKTMILISVLALAACSKAPETMPGEAAEGSSTPAAAEAPAAPEDAAKVALAQCVVCHKMKAGEGNSLGPNLAGVVGRKAGAVEGFNYSPAMKNSGLTWDEATLDKYLEKPMAFLPGNRMSYAGQADAAKRKAMIEALKAAK